WYGRCEVVCFTADHNASFSSLTEARVRLGGEAWGGRTAGLGPLPGVEEGFCFGERGEALGVTARPPPGQIHALPVVTPRSLRMLESARRHGSLFASVLAAERAAKERVVVGNEHWTAFVPVAARWPYEIHLYPHRGVVDIPALSSVERDAFAPVYLEV